MKSVKLRPQSLTDDAFAPYGRVIGGNAPSEPDFINENGTRGWRIDLQIAKPFYMTLRTAPSSLTVSKLEHHVNVTQTFMPLGGGAAALVVAKPTPRKRRPSAEDLAAFLLDGSLGYALHVGTWHSLDRLPVAGTSTTWLIITDSDTQADLVNVSRGTAAHTEEIDLPAEWGFSVEIDI